jgi:hypothetical protein
MPTPNPKKPDAELAHTNNSDGLSVRRESRLHTPDLECSMGRVADMTPSGMRLIFAKGQEPEVGTVQSYTFKDGRDVIEISGTVKWVRKGSAFSRRSEVGVEFVDLSQGQRDTLVQLAVNGKIKNTESRYVHIAEPDLYKLLGVTRYASDEQIDRAFDESSKRWGGEDAHHPKAAEKLDEICKAYAVLSDPQKRANYDKRFADQHDRAA